MKDSNRNIILEQALACLKIGLAPIPVGVNKKALVPWKQYQNILPTEEQVRKWFTRFPNASIAIITGEVPDLMVVDIDPRHGGSNELFKDIATVSSRTGGGGWHYFFKYKDGMRNHAGIKPGVDIRAEGGYVLIPPSQHKSGNNYEWIISPFGDTPVAPLPEFVEEWIKEEKVKVYSTNKKNKSGKAKVGKFDESILNGVAEGQRNTAATSYAGHLFATLPQEEWDTILEILFTWNKRNKPPLPEEEIQQVYESIRAKEQSKQNEKQNEENQTEAIQLTEQMQKEQVIFFHNDLQEGFAAIHGNGRKVHKIRSNLFEYFVSHFFYKQTGKVISSSVLENTIRLLEGRAIFDGQLYELSVRVAFKNEAIWYDIGDGSVVFIDKDGWTISDTPPILFRQYSHQLTQVLPVRGGRLSELLSFVNLESDEDKLLFLVFTVMAFIPGFPHAILTLFGPQGSGKTTPQRLLKALIDPSALKVLSAPNSVKEFVQQAAHHYFFFYDNLSFLPEWLSDCLTRAVTGDGFSKRELFSDDDDIIYSYQRTIGLNGINLVVQKADLLERSILLGLERIPKNKRRTEKEYWEAFEQKKPYLLGAIFDAVAGAIREYPNSNLTEYPRMADFCQWGCAIAKALGYTQEQFLQSYYHNIARQNTEAIEASPVATAIIFFMEKHGSRDPWEGTASDLLTKLIEQAESLKLDVKAKLWPKDPAALSRRLHVAQTNLAEEQIHITWDDTKRPKRILIRKNKENPDNGDTSTDNDNFEAEDEMSGFDTQADNPDINADRDSQSQNDGMTGLSGFSEVVTVPNELLELQKNPNYGQYFPAQPYERYSDGQIRDGLLILNDFEKEITELLGSKELYEELINNFQKEIEIRNGQDEGGEHL